MNCRQINKYLNPYMQGLCTPEEHRKVEAHLRICRVCAAELSELREIVEILGDAGSVPRKPAAAWSRIHDRVMADLEVPLVPWHERVRRVLAVRIVEPVRYGWHQPWLRPVAAGVAGMALLVGAAFFVDTRSPAEPPVAQQTARQASLRVAAVLRAQGMVGYRSGGDAEESKSLGTTTRVMEKGRITTGEGGAVHVGLGAGTGFVLVGGSDLTIAALRRDSVCLFVHRGTVLARVERREPGQVFRVETPDGACRVVGTRFAVRMHPGTEGGERHAEFWVQKGAIDVFPSLGTADGLSVGEGERARVSPDGSVVCGEAALDTARFASLDTMLGLLGLRTAAPVRSEGRVQVVSEPEGALVRVDGVGWGRTPLFSLIRPGAYTVTVTKDGYESWTERITAPLSGTYHLSVSLKKSAERVRAAVAARRRRRAAGNPVEQSLLEAGRGKLRSGDHAEALRAFQMIIEQASVSEEIRREALEGAYELCLADSNYERALAYLNALADGERRDAKTERALVARARLKEDHLEDIGGATKDFVRCLVEYPNGSHFREATEGFAGIVHRIGHRWRARRAYQRHLDLFQKSPEGLKILGELARVWEERFDECALALPCYALIVQEYADSPEMELALFGYADCLRRTGRTDKAHEAYELYARKFPTGARIAAVREHLRERGEEHSRESRVDSR